LPVSSGITIGVANGELKGDAATLTGVASGEPNGAAAGGVAVAGIDGGRAIVGLSPSLFANQATAAFTCLADGSPLGQVVVGPARRLLSGLEEANTRTPTVRQITNAMKALETISKIRFRVKRYRKTRHFCMKIRENRVLR
jgi:hypothetical protein